jgi:hypothetical protein
VRFPPGHTELQVDWMGMRNAQASFPLGFRFLPPRAWKDPTVGEGQNSVRTGTDLWCELEAESSVSFVNTSTAP